MISAVSSLPRGGGFYAVDGVSVNPNADRPLWIGDWAQPAVERGARLGDAWVANADRPRTSLDKRVRTVAKASQDVAVIIRRNAIVLNEAETAEATADALLADGYRGWEPDTDWVLVGDVETAPEELRALQAAAEEVVIRPMSVTMPSRRCLESL